MVTTVLGLDQVCVALERSGARFTQLLRSSSPDAHAVGEWTVGDVAAHMAHAFENYPRLASGEASIELATVTQYNAEILAKDRNRELGPLADRIDAGLAASIELLRSSGGEGIRWYSDRRMEPSHLGALMLGEILVHGYDVAKGTGAAWTIEPAHAALTIEGVGDLAPEYVDEAAAEGFTACFDINIRGGARRFFVFDAGKLTLEEPSMRRVDCHISAEPVTFLLLSYGRLNPIKPALTGRILTWGKKPWLGLKLPRLLKNP